MSEEKKETRRIPWLWIGLVFTVGIFGFGIYLAFQQNCYWQGPSPAGCMPNWKYFLNSPPNEMGDTLAGFAGALAFIWLVVAVMLQNQELRHALDEYEKMADAMQRQAEVAQEQLIALQMDNRRKAQEENDKYAVEKLRDCAAIFDRGVTPLRWGTHHVFQPARKQYARDWEHLLTLNITDLNAVAREVLEAAHSDRLVQKQLIPTWMCELEGHIEILQKLSGNLSNEMRARVKRTGLMALAYQISDDTWPEIWDWSKS